MKIFKTRLIILAFISVSWLSCRDQPTCIPEQTDLMKIVFVNEFGAVTEIEITQFLIEGIPVLKDTSFTAVTIPLNPADSSINFTFYQEADTNTLTISYRSTPIISNPECAIESKFDFLKVDSSSFQNTIIVDPLLSLETTQNVQIAH